jgi:hypothetical protein
MQVYWGDIHNHNAIGYGAGSLQRTLRIAEETLDFIALTPHGAWLDHEPEIPENYIKVWRQGSELLKKKWPEVVSAAATENRVVTFLGQEIHSSEFGDYCLIYPDCNADFFASSDVEKAREIATATGALMIPHHVAYPQGRRGCNWSRFEERFSPLVEIFSEHGSSFDPDDEWPMEGHSFGPRNSANSILQQLRLGRKFGFVASTDNHWGVPGAYGEGTCAVLATERSKDAIFDALRKRRAYAVTGDRIIADFQVNGAGSGSEIPDKGSRDISCDIETCAPLSCSEIYKNGQLIHTFLPGLHTGERKLGGRMKLRLEYGWGPWSKLEQDYVSEWQFKLTFKGCRISKMDKYFRSYNFVHSHEHEVKFDSQKVAVISYTSRNTENKSPNNSLLFELLDFSPDAEIELAFTKPYAVKFKYFLRDLLNDNRTDFLYSFPQEAFCLHRLLDEEDFCHHFEYINDSKEREEDSYCMRIVQRNNQMAWLSPIWVCG